MDAHRALEALAAVPEVGLVLTDIVLPGGRNGTELAREAQALRPELPVLYMSGYMHNALLDAGRVRPWSAMLEKPFTRQQLGRAVRATLDAHAATP